MKSTIEAVRYFKTIKHPLGEGVLMSISVDVKSKEDATKFLEQGLLWEDGVEVEEITKEQYLKECEED